MSLKEYFEKNQAAAVEPAPEVVAEEVPAQPAVADPSAVHTAVAAQEVSETAQNGDAVEVVADDQETLVNVTEEIEKISAEHQGLSVESLLFASIIVDRACRRLGLPEDTLQLPAMESVKLDDRVQVSTEALTLSAEGIGRGLSSILQNQISSVKRAWSFVGTRTSFRIGQIQRLLKLAEETTGKSDGKSLQCHFDYLHERGQIPSRVVPFVLKFLGTAKKIVADFEHDAAESYMHFIEQCDKIELTDVKKFEAGLTKLASSIRDPRNKLTPQEIAGPHPGGLVLFFSEKPRYQGSMEAAKKLDAFATKNVPTRVGFQNERSHGSRKGVIKPLSLDEIKAFCKAAEETLAHVNTVRGWAIGFLDGLSTFVPTPSNLLYYALLGPAAGIAVAGVAASKGSLAAQDHITPVSTTRAVRQQYRAELKAVRDAHRTLHRMCFYVGTDAALATLTVTGAMVPIVKASLRTYK